MAGQQAQNSVNHSSLIRSTELAGSRLLCRVVFVLAACGCLLTASYSLRSGQQPGVATATEVVRASAPGRAALDAAGTNRNPNVVRALRPAAPSGSDTAAPGPQFNRLSNGVFEARQPRYLATLSGETGLEY